MGLFGGSFGMGLAQGLAGSIDNALQTAMEKRDEDVSRTQRFYEMRQAQKMDMADEHDRRAKRALESLIREHNGDVAKGLATYQAMGGTVEDVELELEAIKNTRNVLGSYNINDHLNLEGIDFSQYADLTAADAFQSIRMDLPGAEVQFQETGLLQNIGLPLRGNVGADISASINTMIPPRDRTLIPGLNVGTYNASETLSSQLARMDLELKRAQLDRATQPPSDKYVFNFVQRASYWDDSYSPEATRKNLNVETLDTGGIRFAYEGVMYQDVGDNLDATRKLQEIDAKNRDTYIRQFIYEPDGSLYAGAGQLLGHTGIPPEFVEALAPRTADISGASTTSELSVSEDSMTLGGVTLTAENSAQLIAENFQEYIAKSVERGNGYLTEQERQNLLTQITTLPGHNVPEDAVATLLNEVPFSAAPTINTAAGTALPSIIEARPPDYVVVGRRDSAAAAAEEVRKIEQQQWDELYSQNYNPDGTLKQG